LLPSGRFQASFTGPDTRRYVAPVTFEKRSGAERWLANEERRVEQADNLSEWVPPSSKADIIRSHKAALTVADYARQWLESNTELRPGTRVLYEALLRLHIVPGVGGVRIDRLTRQQVETWWASTEQKRIHHQAYALLRTILKRATEDGVIRENPCLVRGAGKPSREKNLDPLTPAQVQAIADHMPDRWRIGVMLAAWCGLRSGEVRELRRGDLDLKRGLLSITRATARAGKRIVVGAPKTDAGIRTIPIPSGIVTALEEHLARFVSASGRGLVLSMSGGGPVNDSTWRDAFTLAVYWAFTPESERMPSHLARSRRADWPDYVPRITFHDLRHVALTNAGLAGATLRELQALAGHTTPAMAMRYQEVSRSHLAEVMDRVSGMMPEAGSD
jgi:integrase